MRREDKRRVPPRLKVRLPPGYRLEAVPYGYQLHLSYSFGAGRMSEFVCSFTADSTPEEIEAVAWGSPWPESKGEPGVKGFQNIGASRGSGVSKNQGRAS